MSATVDEGKEPVGITWTGVVVGSSRGEEEEEEKEEDTRVLSLLAVTVCRRELEGGGSADEDAEGCTEALVVLDPSVSIFSSSRSGKFIIE